MCLLYLEASLTLIISQHAESVSLTGQGLGVALSQQAVLRVFLKYNSIIATETQSGGLKMEAELTI